MQTVHYNCKQQLAMEIYKIALKPTQFNTLQNVVITLIKAKGTTWGMTVTEVDDIVAFSDKWIDLFDKSREEMTKNKGATADRNKNKPLYEEALTAVFEKHLTNNDAISAADKAAMGIHETTSTHTPVPKPKQAPAVTVRNGAALQLIIDIRNAGNGKLGKPKGVGFVEMWYKIGDPEPRDLSDTNLKINISQSGEAITFILSQKGMTVYFFARWVTTKGGLGPWGKHFSGVIA